MCNLTLVLKAHFKYHWISEVVNVKWSESCKVGLRDWHFSQVPRQYLCTWKFKNCCLQINKNIVIAVNPKAMKPSIKYNVFQSKRICNREFSPKPSPRSFSPQLPWRSLWRPLPRPCLCPSSPEEPYSLYPLDTLGLYFLPWLSKHCFSYSSLPISAFLLHIFSFLILVIGLVLSSIVFWYIRSPWVILSIVMNSLYHLYINNSRFFQFLSNVFPLLHPAYELIILKILFCLLFISLPMWTAFCPMPWNWSQTLHSV